MAQPGPPPGGPQPQAVGFGSVLPWDPTRGGLEGPHGVRGSVGWGVPRHQPRDWGRWRPGGVSHGGGVSCRRQGPLGYGGIWGPHWGGGLWEGTSGTCGGPLGDLWGSRGNRGWGPHRGRGCPHGVLVPHRVPRGVPTGGSGAPRGGPMCPWVTPFGGGGAPRPYRTPTGTLWGVSGGAMRGGGGPLGLRGSPRDYGAPAGVAAAPRGPGGRGRPLRCAFLPPAGGATRPARSRRG